MLNRRQVVSGLASLAVLGSRGWAAYAASARQKSASVSLQGPLSKSAFLALQGDTFTVYSGNDSISIQLIQIDDGPPSTETEQFSLVFRGPHDPVLPDGPREVSHRTAGTTTLFLQPSGQDRRHTYYEAAFNLLR